jgi:hypothetical protein
MYQYRPHVSTISPITVGAFVKKTLYKFLNQTCGPVNLFYWRRWLFYKKNRFTYNNLHPSRSPSWATGRSCTPNPRSIVILSEVAVLVVKPLNIKLPRSTCNRSLGLSWILFEATVLVAGPLDLDLPSRGPWPSSNHGPSMCASSTPALASVSTVCAALHIMTFPAPVGSVGV